MSRQTKGPRERAILARIEQTVLSAEPEATVLLFGSRARGDARAGSDWDVLVLVDGPVDGRRWDTVGRRLMHRFDETEAMVEPLVISWDDWNSPSWRVLPFHQNVEADSIELTSNKREIPPVTEKAMAEARAELIRTLLEQAQEALDDAEYNAAGKRWRACVGRLYYAAFYAVSALLISQDYRFSGHHGVETLFNRHFGETGIIAADLVALYNQLHNNRLLADYSGKTKFEEAQVRPWIAETGRLLATLERLVQAPPEP